MTTPPNILATNLKDAYRVCDVVPLQDVELERYYVDLSKTRKTDAIDSITLILDDQKSGDCVTILFTGHRGSAEISLRIAAIECSIL